MSQSPVCVECAWSPSGNMNTIGFFATIFSRTSTPKAKKRLVAPESNMAHFLIFIGAYFEEDVGMVLVY